MVLLPPLRALPQVLLLLPASLLLVFLVLLLPEFQVPLQLPAFLALLLLLLVFLALHPLEFLVLLLSQVLLQPSHSLTHPYSLVLRLPLRALPPALLQLLALLLPEFQVPLQLPAFLALFQELLLPVFPELLLPLELLQPSHSLTHPYSSVLLPPLRVLPQALLLLQASLLLVFQVLLLPEFQVSLQLLAFPA